MDSQADNTETLLWNMEFLCLLENNLYKLLKRRNRGNIGWDRLNSTPTELSAIRPQKEDEQVFTPKFDTSHKTTIRIDAKYFRGSSSSAYGINNIFFNQFPICDQLGD